MRRVLATTLLGLAGLLLVSASRTGAESPRIDDAWIKYLPPVVQVRAGYLRVRNPGDRPVDLTGAESPDFERIEMHETLMKGDSMRMVRAESFTVPAHGELVLAPGGRHLMMFAPTRRLNPGDRVEVELEFGNGGRVPAIFEVRP